MAVSKNSVIKKSIFWKEKGRRSKEKEK